MSFGKIIKKLRRERDMTQEKLAEILSISPQAVSRWETDMAMPDISLLPSLCNLFNITADELLEIDLSHKRENVNAICKDAEKYSDRGYLEEARKILEDGLNKYPDDLEIIYHLMYLSSFQRDKTGDKKYLDEAIKWGEKLLSQSTDDMQRHSAIQILCYSYRDVGRLDEAVKMAESMPFMHICRESLFSSIYSGDKGYASKQSEAIALLQFLSISLSSLQVKLDSGKYAYTDDECAILRDKRIAFLHLFFENGDFGFYHTHLYDTHRDQATYYAKKSEDDMALRHLKSAAEHAIKFTTSNNEKRTSLVFRGMSGGSWSTNSTDNDASRMLVTMESSAFDRIRKREDFVKIKEQLRKYAGAWDVK